MDVDTSNRYAIFCDHDDFECDDNHGGGVKRASPEQGVGITDDDSSEVSLRSIRRQRRFQGS